MRFSAITTRMFPLRVMQKCWTSWLLSLRSSGCASITFVLPSASRLIYMFSHSLHLKFCQFLKLSLSRLWTWLIKTSLNSPSTASDSSSYYERLTSIASQVSISSSFLITCLAATFSSTSRAPSCFVQDVYGQYCLGVQTHNERHRWHRSKQLVFFTIVTNRSFTHSSLLFFSVPRGCEQLRSCWNRCCKCVFPTVLPERYTRYLLRPHRCRSQKWFQAANHASGPDVPASWAEPNTSTVVRSKRCARSEHDEFLILKGILL